MLRSSRRPSRSWPGWVAALALGALCGTAAAGSRPDRVLAELQEPHRQHVPAELLVQFEPALAEAAYDDALARVGGRFVERVSGDLHRIALPAGTDLAGAIRALHAAPGVDFAEPNWLYHADAVADDPYYVSGQLWGMYGDSSPLKQNAYGSQAAEAWDRGHVDCGKVMVAVIDEGAQYKHPDLRRNFWQNPAEVPDNGIDDDGNGFIDDSRGWDFARDDKSTYDGIGDDHGTHVSGTIGARGGNGKGVAGVCWKVKLINVKFLGTSSGTTANAIKSIDYVTDLKIRHRLNLVAINASWGGGLLAGFSNYGATSVDLGAPGVAVFSTVPTGTGYAAYSGTSMAAPHVAGAIALYASSHPGKSAKALKEAILSTIVPMPSLAGKTVTGGWLDVSGY